MIRCQLLSIMEFGYELCVAQSIIRDLFFAVVSNKSLHPSAMSLCSPPSLSKVVCIRGRVEGKCRTEILRIGSSILTSSEEPPLDRGGGTKRLRHRVVVRNDLDIVWWPPMWQLLPTRKRTCRLRLQVLHPYSQSWWHALELQTD